MQVGNLDWETEEGPSEEVNKWLRPKEGAGVLQGRVGRTGGSGNPHSKHKGLEAGLYVMLLRN